MIDVNTVLQAIEEGEWTVTPGEEEGEFIATIEGECCDGMADWQAIRSGCCYQLKSTLGWYEQQGEADSLEELVQLARAMKAAAKALNESLYAQKMGA